MPYKDGAEFKAEYDKEHDRWVTCGFYEHRNSWTDILNRRYTFKLDSFLEEHRQGIDIQLPSVEEDRDQHVQIMTLDEPRFDCTSLENSEDAKDDVEDARIWHAASAMRQNEGGKLLKAQAQALVQIGVAVDRKDWNMIKEPGEDYYESRHLEADDDEGRLGAREEYYRECDQEVFTTVSVDARECCWAPLANHTRFWQRFVVPYSEGKHTLKSLDGKSVGVNELGHLVLLGDRRPADVDAYEKNLVEQKQIEVLICDEQDPESGEWWCYEYICWEGEENWENAQKLNEYRNPLGMSRFYVTERGDAPALETNPHLRFRPILYSEYVLASELAYLQTVFAVFSRMQLDNRLIYVDANSLTTEAATALGFDLMTTNNAGAQTYVAKEVSTGSGVIAVLPEMKAYPWPTPEALQFQIEQKQIAFQMVRPNRFLTAKYGDAREPDSTATQYLDQKQAAALPYSSHLSMIAATWKKMAQGEENAIIFWEDEGVKAVKGADNSYEEDDDEPKTKAQKRRKSKQYRVVTTSDEPLLTSPVDAGREVVVTADTFRRRKTITVQIKNETQAERMQNDLAADDAYLVKHALTEEQWLKARGFADPRKQLKDREKDRQRQAMQAELQPTRIANMKKFISAETQQDLMTPAPPLRSEMMQQPQTQGQGSMVTAGPAITPAPVEQPGGSAGMGGIS